VRPGRDEKLRTNICSERSVPPLPKVEVWGTFIRWVGPKERNEKETVFSHFRLIIMSAKARRIL